MAWSMALNSTSSSNGFVKNSTAPAFMAWTVIGTLPLPEIKMIGMSVRSTATRFCSARPLRSGRLTSSTKQLGARTRGQDRNSSADANVSGCQPAESISNSSDLRTEMSSSTTNTIGVACDIGDDLETCTTLNQRWSILAPLPVWAPSHLSIRYDRVSFRQNWGDEEFGGLDEPPCARCGECLGPGWHLHVTGRCDRPELPCVPLIVYKDVDD